MATLQPFGVTVSSRNVRSISREEMELASEIADVQAAQEKSRQQFESRRDEIDKLIGASYYIQQMSFPMQQYRGMSLCVTRWYPQKGVAIDIFHTIGREEKSEMEFKSKFFKRMHFRYAALSYQSEISELMPQLGLL